MGHLVRIPLRWGDMDAQGHLNNGVYIDYLQEARVEFLLSGPQAGLLGSGILVVGHQIEFVRPVVYSDVPLEIELAVESVGAARLVLHYEIREGEHVCARARTTLAPYDLVGGRLRRLTAPEREFFAGALEPGEPFRALPKVPVGDRGQVTELFVRWGDLDAYGHVNNVRFFDYVQEARIAVIHRLLGETDPGLTWVVVRQDIDYLAQLGHRLAPYQAHTLITSVGRTSATLACDIRDDQSGVIYASARTVLVCADRSGRPVPIPDDMKVRVRELT